MDSKKITAPVAIAAVALMVGVGGGLMINAMQADAASSSTNSPAQSQSPPANQDQSQAYHVGSNGVKEALLTGDAADKVRAAAQAAVPGGTILRVETDAEGSPYEAHATKSDGTAVTVKVDSNFKVTGTENGPNSGRGSASANTN
jgi:hypothetical protein